MRNIKRAINKMVELLDLTSDKAPKEDMPLFMQNLLLEIKRPGVHLNVRIFILKILVNNPQLFQRFATHWFEPLCHYIVQKETGGKGFHYFLRDLCTMIISWNFVPNDTPKNRELCTQVVNTLIKCSADKAKLIFNTNIQIVAALIHRWRKLIAINKPNITKMINSQVAADKKAAAGKEPRKHKMEDEEMSEE